MYNGLIYTPIDFYEQAKHIRGPRKTFTFLSKTLLPSYKITLELKQWTKRNQELMQ
jgi:hypothetical protein